MLVLETERVEEFIDAICNMAPSHRDAVCDLLKDVLKQLKVEEYCRKKTQDKCDEFEKELESLIARSSTEDVYEDEEESNGET